MTTGVLPEAVQQAFRDAGLPVPQQANLQIAVVTPPGPGRCCHCGVEVPADQHRRAHAVAGFEQTDLRMEVTHCDGCVDSAACDPNQTTPGSGHPAGSPGGFCEPVQEG